MIDINWLSIINLSVYICQILLQTVFLETSKQRGCGHTFFFLLHISLTYKHILNTESLQFYILGCLLSVGLLEISKNYLLQTFAKFVFCKTKFYKMANLRYLSIEIGIYGQDWLQKRRLREIGKVLSIKFSRILIWGVCVVAQGVKLLLGVPISHIKFPWKESRL